MPRYPFAILVILVSIVPAGAAPAEQGPMVRLAVAAEPAMQELVADDEISARRRGRRHADPPPEQGAAAIARICLQETLGSPDGTAERVAQAITPSPEQRAVLDELKAAMEKATASLRETCTAPLPMNGVARLETVERQLAAMHAALQTLRPALEKLDASLTDEQRTRFGLTTAYASSRDDPRAVATLCDIAAGLTRWPHDVLVDELRPDFAQRNALIDLWAASAKARNALEAQCPREAAYAPFARLRTLEKRVEVARDALRNVRVALAEFYRALNDEQKARFDHLQIGEQRDEWPSERRRRRR